MEERKRKALLAEGRRSTKSTATKSLPDSH
jgi:hypothetical protein